MIRLNFFITQMMTFTVVICLIVGSGVPEHSPVNPYIECLVTVAFIVWLCSSSYIYCYGESKK